MYPAAINMEFTHRARKVGVATRKLKNVAIDQKAAPAAVEDETKNLQLPSPSLPSTLPTEFPTPHTPTNFSSLPVELKLQIWRYVSASIFSSPQTVTYQHHPGHIRGRITSSRMRVPSILHTCHLSRSVALESHHLAFRPFGQPLYFSFTNDTFRTYSHLLNPPHLNPNPPGPLYALSRSLALIHNLVLWVDWFTFSRSGMEYSLDLWLLYFPSLRNLTIEIWRVVAADIEVLGCGMAAGMGYIERVIERGLDNWWRNAMWPRQRVMGMKVTSVPELRIQWV
jgi:hypothetical protein